MSNHMDDVFRMSAGEVAPKPTKATTPAPLHQAIANVFTVLALLILACSPAIIYAVYKAAW